MIHPPSPRTSASLKSGYPWCIARVGQFFSVKQDAPATTQQLMGRREGNLHHAQAQRSGDRAAPKAESRAVHACTHFQFHRHSTLPSMQATFERPLRRRLWDLSLPRKIFALVKKEINIQDKRERREGGKESNYFPSWGRN